MSSKCIRYAVLMVAVLSLTFSSSNAFAPAAGRPLTNRHKTISQSTRISSPSALQERRWNFNDGEGPFGMKSNAEIWNGRVAQVCFVVIFIQELVQGKGVIQGIAEGDIINLAFAGVTLFSFVALTAFLALRGTDDYVAAELEKGE